MKAASKAIEIPEDVLYGYCNRKYGGETVRTVVPIEAGSGLWSAAIIEIPEYQFDDLESADVIKIHEWCGHRHEPDSARLYACCDRLER